MPISLAMAKAVCLWSPVIIIGLMPAFKHFLTASLTSGLGGSIMPTRPTKIKSSSVADFAFELLSFLYARASTLKALPPIFLFAEIISFFFSVESSQTLPPVIIFVHLFSTISGAPFVY